MRRLRTVLLFVALAAVGVAASARTLTSPRRALGAASSAAEQSAHVGEGGVKHWAFTIVALLAVLAVGGFLVAVSGIVPIKASSGHWPITTWFLQLAKHRSVATHTLGLKAPALDEPQLVLKGAGHYETGCRPCHGSPELRHPRIVQQMLPPPPYLPPRLSAWEPDELFYIVKHGIKFTGMPAWPARQRDDEVWAMVAFLRALPTLDAAAYRRLVHGDATPHETVVPLHGLLAPGEGAPHGDRQLRTLSRRGRPRTGRGRLPETRWPARYLPPGLPGGLCARRAPQRADGAHCGRPQPRSDA